jgi:hypothetical protein
MLRVLICFAHRLAGLAALEQRVLQLLLLLLLQTLMSLIRFVLILIVTVDYKFFNFISCFLENPSIL